MVLQSLWTEFSHTFIKFVYAPFIFPEMLWIVFPVIGAIILMELYFSRYSRDSIGHHKSLENTIFLLFISVDLIRYVITSHAPAIKFVLIGFSIIFFLTVAIMDFFHRLPLILFLRTSSKFVVAYVSYALVVLIYSDMLATTGFLHLLSVALTVMLIFALIVFIKKMISFLEPRSYEEIEQFLKHIETDIKKASEETDKSLEEHNKIEKTIKKKKNSHPR